MTLNSDGMSVERPHRETPQRGRPWLLSVAMLSFGLAAGTLATVWLTGAKVPNSDDATLSQLAEALDLPPAAIHATATHGVDNFAVATGMLDNETEAIYFLDFLTAELKGASISRQSNQFTAFYKRKILGDFEKIGDGEPLKNPRFLLVTGLGQLQQQGSRTRMGRALIYVVEVTSGKVVAYGAPESRATRTSGKKSFNDLVPVDTLSLRKRGSVRSDGSRKRGSRDRD